jgi:purine catabolism regulator
VSVPTVATLCSSLPRALVPAPGFDAPDRTVSAVHVSELGDPTEYLSGGELLLTTGLSLPGDARGCAAYVARLVAAGVSALGVGLGPSLSAVPERLVEACLQQGLCLLVVPPDAAFLTVSKAYWEARSRSTQQELTDAITAHRSLVDAMASRDPVGETLKALSRAIGAWCARLDPAGGVEHVFPGARVADAMAVAEQIADLRVAGIHSSATFPSNDEIVAVFPLPLEDRVVGYIAIGSTSPLLPTARRLVLTAGALLSLDSVQRQRSDAARQAQMQAVSTLLDMGHVEPSRRLASRMGLAPVGDAVRVLVVGSPRAADVTEAVSSWMPEAMPAPFEAQTSWFVIPALHPDTEPLATHLRRVDARITAVLSDTVAPPMVHGVRVGLAKTVATLPAGTVLTPQDHSPGTDRVHEGVHRVLEHRRTDLTGTLVAYLRHRGQWDAAAREAGVHRNTVRHRMTTIRELLDADPDDPDVAAEVWLYLRGNGLA